MTPLGWYLSSNFPNPPGNVFAVETGRFLMTPLGIYTNPAGSLTRPVTFLRQKRVRFVPSL